MRKGNARKYKRCICKAIQCEEQAKDSYYPEPFEFRAKKYRKEAERYKL